MSNEHRDTTNMVAAIFLVMVLALATGMAYGHVAEGDVALLLITWAAIATSCGLALGFLMAFFALLDRHGNSPPKSEERPEPTGRPVRPIRTLESPETREKNERKRRQQSRRH